MIRFVQGQKYISLFIYFINVTKGLEMQKKKGWKKNRCS